MVVLWWCEIEKNSTKFWNVRLEIGGQFETNECCVAHGENRGGVMTLFFVQCE